MSRTLLLFALVVCAFLFGQTRPLPGYALLGHNWPNGTAANPYLITMNLQLSSATYPYPEQFTGGFFPTYGLQDGSGSWNAVAQAALNDWNQYLQNVQFVSNTDASFTPASGDHINSVLFSSTAFGQSFGVDAIAVTLRYHNISTNYTSEADVVVNTAYLWDSYRGNLQYNYNYGENIYDLRRVLDHEFGHVLGLDHPDQATPPQNVVAIMNSTVSNLDHIEVDDINGAMFLYGQKTILEPISVVASPSNGGTVTGNGNFQLGSTQQLIATPTSGYGFVQWDDGTTNPTRSITVGLQGGSYTATFAAALDAWATVATGNTITNLNAILYVNGAFMVFGGNGLVTSSDGVTWTSHIPTVTSNYNPAAVAYHNGTYVSVGSGGAAWSSSDGLNWTSRQTAFTGDSFYAVTYGNGLFVAVGGTTSNYGTAPVMTSPDGITWTLQTQGVPVISGSFLSLVYANGIFAAVGASSGNSALAMTSPDGIIWSATVLPFYYVLTSITYGKGTFVACNYSNIYTSFDGITWTQRASNDYNYRQVIYGNGTFLAASYGVESSPDGITWTLRNPVNSFYYPSNFAYGNGRFAAETSSGINISGALALVPSPVLPMINSGLTFHAEANAPLMYQISAANTPLAYNAISLPPGLTVNAQTGAITGMPTSSGTYPIKLFATNDAGSGTANLTLTVVTPVPPQSFTNWAGVHSIVGGLTGTPKNDGVPNLLKYLYDINPTGTMSATDRAALPVIGMTANGGDNYLTLTYRQNQSLTGYAVIVQTSSDLESWSTPPNSSIVPTGSLDPSTDDPMMQAQVPMTGTNQFIRLNVVPTP